jgi:hypothetical protein
MIAYRMLWSQQPPRCQNVPKPSPDSRVAGSGDLAQVRGHGEEARR